MRRGHWFVLALGLAVFVAYFIDVAFFAYIRDHVPDNTKHAKAYLESNATTPSFVVTNLMTFVNWLGNMLHKFHNEIIAAFTVILVVVTAALARYTYLLWAETAKLGQEAKGTSDRQAREMESSLQISRDAADVARKEFHLVHRPRLTIRREQVRFNPKDNGILFVLANTGDLPATKIGGNINIRVVPTPKQRDFEREALPPYGNSWIDIGDVLIKHGRASPDLTGSERAFIYVPSPEICDDSMIAVKYKESVLYFFGFIDFTGPDGIKRDSAFFRTYDPETETFVSSDDPDYERS